jgi:hypothetical protein
VVWNARELVGVKEWCGMERKSKRRCPTGMETRHRSLLEDSAGGWERLRGRGERIDSEDGDSGGMCD